MGQRFIQEGTGWRLGWDDTAPCYKGLLGGVGWALELTEPEFEVFCRLAHQVTQSMVAMTTELMEEERLTCEADSDLVWLEVEGFPTDYTLRFMLHTGRRGEGQWDGQAAEQLVQAITHLTVF
ncbi:MAG: DUF1818 family protein [Leptolyngbyaceae cyanobacterium SM2_5_2]|nr:DUF1818 family protein [Leptolyngbyaceae cyanobacterium SM2_5_2]